jgi:hypothetical protein
VFHVRFEVVSSALDVSIEDNAEVVGILFERLRSNDLEENARYLECRALAAEVDGRGNGILYPSTALRDEATNLVCFGPQAPDIWRVTMSEEVDRPVVDPGIVTVLRRPTLIDESDATAGRRRRPTRRRA